MTLATLSAIDDAISWPVLITWWGCLFLRHRAVNNSRQRYTLSNLAITFATIYLLCLVVRCLQYLRDGDYLNAAIATACFVTGTWHIWMLLQDDNWFNNQYKKLKRGFKHLSRQLSSWTSAAPSPA